MYEYCECLSFGWIQLHTNDLTTNIWLARLDPSKRKRIGFCIELGNRFLCREKEREREGVVMVKR